MRLAFDRILWSDYIIEVIIVNGKVRIKRFGFGVIQKSDIKALLLLFPFIEVHVFNIGYLYNITVLLATVYVFFLFVAGRVSLKKEYLPLLAYALLLVLSCFLNGLSVIPGIYYGFKLVAFTQIVEYYIQNKDYSFFRALRWYMTLCIVITTFFQIFDQGFFGYNSGSLNYYNFSFGDNVLGYYYIPFIAVCIVMDRIQGESTKISNETLVIIVLSVISLLRAWSGKSVVGIALIVMYVLFIFGRKLQKIFTARFVVIVNFAIEVGIVVFNLQDRFAYIIETILHKDVTLTGRTVLWSSAIRMISKSPVYGYGITNGGTIKLYYLYGSSTHPVHNLILELLSEVGVTGLVLWFLYIVLSISVKKETIRKYKDTYHMLLFFIFVVLLMQITSGNIYHSILFYLLAAMCLNMEALFAGDWKGI